MDGGAWEAAVHGVTKSWTLLSDFTFTFHFHALEREMLTHSRVLAWRIPGMEEPCRLPSMGLHRVRHGWSDLEAATFGYYWYQCLISLCDLGLWCFLVYTSFLLHCPRRSMESARYTLLQIWLWNTIQFFLKICSVSDFLEYQVQPHDYLTQEATVQSATSLHPFPETLSTAAHTGLWL